MITVVPAWLLRIFVSLVIGLVAWLVYLGIKRYTLIRTKHQSDNLPGLSNGIPAILYFTTPDCGPCKTIQRPALRKIKESMGEAINIIEVDATTEIDLAKAWKVLSVPTTFIIDPQGETRFVNNGAVRAEKLKQQINSL